MSGTAVFIPCSHNILCRACDELMQERKVRKCPICREQIWGRASMDLTSSTKISSLIKVENLVD